MCAGHTSPGLAKMSGLHNLASTEALNQDKAGDEVSTTVSCTGLASVP